MELNINLNQILQDSTTSVDSKFQPSRESSSGLWIVVGVVLFNLAVIVFLTRCLKK